MTVPEPTPLALEGGPRGWPGEYPPPFYGADLIGEEEIEAVSEVLRSRSLFRYYGPDLRCITERFERELGDFLGISHTLGVTSGTAALRTALAACGIGSDNEVILPAFTFIATPNAVLLSGATPVFADVDASFGLDVDAVEARLTERTRAVVAVHIQGAACELEPLVELCRRHHLTLIEDCAQAFGTRYQGTPVGRFGAAAAFSFQQNKLLSTGEGGAVALADGELLERARIFHDQGGRRRRFEYPSFDSPACFFGDNLRMNELIAAIARVQLRKLPGMLEGLRRTKAALRRTLHGSELALRPVPDPDGDAGASVCFTVETEDRRDLWLRALEAEGVRASGFYGRAVYDNRLFRHPRGTRHPPDPSRPPMPSLVIEPCPRCEDLAARAVWIPLHPSFTPEDGERLAGVLLKVRHHLGSGEPS